MNEEKSVLLDTWFLITLVNKEKVYHELAIQFYSYFLTNRYDLVLSSIVLSEFCIKQDFTDLPVNQFKYLSFNIPESYKLSSLFEERFKEAKKLENRICVKDDYKIVSQCIHHKIRYLITADRKLSDIIDNLHSNELSSIFYPNGLNKEQLL